MLLLITLVVAHCQLTGTAFTASSVSVVIALGLIALGLLISHRIEGLSWGKDGVKITASEAKKRQELQKDIDELDRSVTKRALAESPLATMPEEASSQTLQVVFQLPESLNNEEKEKIEEIGKRVHDLEENHVPLEPATYARLAKQLRRAGRFVDAVNAFMKAYELDQTNPAWLNYAGVILSRDVGDHDGAEELYHRALAVDRTYLSPLYNLACNEVRKGYPEEAMSWLALAVKDPRLRDLAHRDEVFDELREDENFRRVVGESDPADE